MKTVVKSSSSSEFNIYHLSLCLITYRGALKYNIKAFSLAVKDLTEAVAIDCKCSLAYFNRAVCYHEMRFFQKVGKTTAISTSLCERCSEVAK